MNFNLKLITRVINSIEAAQRFDENTAGQVLNKIQRQSKLLN